MEETPVEERIEPNGRSRSRRTLVGVTVGVFVAAGLVSYGLSRSDNGRVPSDTPPTIAVIQAPAEVFSTQNPPAPGSPSATEDVPVGPSGTADVAFPPVSSRVLVP